MGQDLPITSAASAADTPVRVPLATKPGEKCYEASAENTYSGDFPISRFLYVYMNKNPNQPLDPVRGEFVRFMLSKQGQEATLKDGYFPMTAEIAAEDLKLLGLTPGS